MFIVNYLGDLRTEAIHTKSNTKINTDAPIDNKGKGECFSPTDLVCVALATCIITTIGIKSQEIDISIENKLKGTSIEIKKIMSIDIPRRITKIKVDLKIPYSPKNENERENLEKFAFSCPVSISLNTDIKQEINFIWNK